jgi:DNA-binding MarR family transcriptional regulator
MSEPRITLQVWIVLAHMLTDPNADYYSYGIARQTGLLPATVTPIVTRLVRVGWLSEETETGDPAVLGRPLRRYVRLTATGIDIARAAQALNRPLVAPGLPANGPT